MSVEEGFALVGQHAWKSIEEAIVVVFVPGRLLLDSVQMCLILSHGLTLRYSVI